MQARHFKVYKPHGYLSQFINNEKTRRNRKLLGELYNFPEGTMAIGRLDRNSEGLLLLTTCGKTSEKIRSKEVEKEYFVQLDGTITDEEKQKLQQGVEISIDKKKYTTLPCRVLLLKSPPSLPPGAKIRDERHGKTSWISIVLKEGKFRQIRKMTAAVGFPTLRLVRVRIAGELLLNLTPGEVEEVSFFKIE